MHRFISNRMWTFILMLCLGLATTTALSARLYADPVVGDEGGGDDTGNTGGSGGPAPWNGAGDPDMPGSTVKSTLRGGARRASVGSTMRIVGDDRAVGSVTMWKFQLVMQSLRKLNFRF